MALATYEITPEVVTMLAGATQGFNAFSNNGQLALINNGIPSWQNLDNCTIQPDGSLRKTSATFAWDSGARSVETINSGSGDVEWLANVVTFGGKSFAAGLTAQALVSSYTHIDFCLVVAEGGVSVWEGGVGRGTFRAPRLNGAYRVGVEDGQVVYRADGDVIYRSGLPVTFPLRFGASFFNPLDQIGGVVDDGDVFWEARSSSGALSGSFSPQESNTIWTAPATRGRYAITARSANNVFASGVANVHKILPGIDQGFPRPGRFREMASEYKVNEQVFDDGAAEYLVPFPDGRIRRWRIEYTGSNRRLSVAQAQVLDDFYNEHRASGFPFFFKDHRTGVTYDNVRFSRYEANHGRLYRRQERVIELIRRPA